MSEAFTLTTEETAPEAAHQPALELVGEHHLEARQHIAHAIGYLVGSRNIEVDGLAPTEAQTYFDTIVFPAVRETREKQNQQNRRKVAAEEINRTLNEKFEEVSSYISGKSFAEIAQETGRKEQTVKASIVKTLRMLSGEHSPYSSQYFESELTSQYPQAELKKQTPQLKTVPAKTGRISRQDNSSIDRDLIGMYLKDIGRADLLDAAQEVELSKRIEAGLMATNKLATQEMTDQEREELEWIAQDGAQAKNEFLTSNLRLVVSIARKYARHMPMLDLIQEGNAGLIRAVEKFDFTKGYKFSTYGTWWIRQSITRGIAQQSRIVRLPVHVVEELNQVIGTQRTLERQLGREPEPHEVASELGIEVDRVHDLVAWGREHISLDTPASDNGDTTIGDLMAHDTAPGPDTTVLDIESQDRLNSLLDQLDGRGADIIRRRFGMKDGRPHKLADIGKDYGISAERIRQLEREAIQKLRKIADPDLAR